MSRSSCATRSALGGSRARSLALLLRRRQFSLNGFARAALGFQPGFGIRPRAASGFDLGFELLQPFTILAIDLLCRLEGDLRLFQTHFGGVASRFGFGLRFAQRLNGLFASLALGGKLQLEVCD